MLKPFENYLDFVWAFGLILQRNDFRKKSNLKNVFLLYAFLLLASLNLFLEGISSMLPLNLRACSLNHPFQV